MFKKLFKRGLSIIYKPIGNLAKKTQYVINIPILCYHSVNDIENTECSAISKENFSSHLKYLSENHSVISLEQIFNSEISANSEKPPIIITFDDGYIDNFQNAFPLLKKYNLPCTIFITTGFINKEVVLIDNPNWRAMDWEHLLLMQNSGIINFGAHTDTHRILADLSPNEAKAEIIKSKKILEEKLHTVINWFAYPNGQDYHTTKTVIENVKNAGFIGATSTLWRSYQNNQKKFMLNRIMIYGSDTIQELSAKIRGDYDYLFYIHKCKGWFYQLVKKFKLHDL